MILEQPAGIPSIWLSSSTTCSIKVVSYKKTFSSQAYNNPTRPQVYSKSKMIKKDWYWKSMTHTWNPSFTVSNCRIGREVGRRHRFGSHKIVLLKANPDISTWNLRSLLLFSFVCHPITWVPLHAGPSNMALFLLWASIATGQVPKRLQSKGC